MSHFVGDSVTLPCRTNFTDLQRWLYISSHNAPQDVITSGSHVQQLNNGTVITLLVSQTSREYNLILHDVQLNEAGWYICAGVSDSDSTTVLPFFLTVHG